MSASQNRSARGGYHQGEPRTIGVSKEARDHGRDYREYIQSATLYQRCGGGVRVIRKKLGSG